MNSKDVVQHAARMSDQANSDNTPVDDRVSHALEEYAASLEKGQPLSRESLLEKYADVAEELAGCLDSLEFIRDIAPQIEEQRPNDGDDVKQQTDQPRATVGDYRIFREIGRGGMGVVYEAEQLSLGRSVALKVLPYAAMMDQKAITRFKNEARAAATLDHPHIVPVYAVGVERGIHYYAMSLIDGLTVAELVSHLRRSITDADNSPARLSIDDFLVRRGDPSANLSASRLEKTIDSGQPTKKEPTDHADETYGDIEAAISTHRSRLDQRFFRSVARLGAQAAEALDHAHQHGIVHRDIKPGNLMIDSNTKLWVTDFGLARIESDASMTMTGDLVGTLRYMAPEQALAKRVVVDHRADVYALGATLYEILALHPAFDGSNREALLRQIAFEDPKPLRQANRGVPKDLQTIVHKALSKNPDDRYQTAAEMEDDLLAFVDDEPIQARPLSIGQRAARWVAKRKSFVTSIAAILILAVIGLAISNAIIAQERNAANEAEQNERTARREADVNAKLAHDTVDKYLTKVSEDQLLNQPLMHPLRKELLELALTYYQDFIQQQPDDPDVQAELADAYERVGKITAEIGSVQDGLQACQKAVSIREKLVMSHPSNQEHEVKLAFAKLITSKLHADLGQYDKAISLTSDATATVKNLPARDAENFQWQLFASYTAFGNHYAKSGQPEEALTQHKHAITVAEDLVHRDPDDMKNQSSLAVAYNNAAADVRQMGSLVESLALQTKCLAINEMLYEKNPGVSLRRWRLGQTYNSLTGVHSLLGHAEDALSLSQRAIPLWERMVEEDPDVLKYAFGLHGAYSLRGFVYLRTGKHDEALSFNEKALLRAKKLVEKDPAVLVYQQRLANSYLNVAETHRGLGQAAEALSCAQQASTILEKLLAKTPGNQPYRRSLANAYQSRGNIHHDSGEEKAAVICWTKTIALGDGVREQQFELFAFIGAAHYRLGNWQKAREVLEKVIRLRGHDRPIPGKAPWWYLTMTLHELGEVELARSYYDQLVERLDKNPRYFPAKMRAEAAKVLGVEDPSNESEGQSSLFKRNANRGH